MKSLLFTVVTGILILTSCVKEESYDAPEEIKVYYSEDSGDILINEIMSKDPDTDFDYIELYNAGDVDVDISDYYINDALIPTGTGAFRIPAGTIISAKGYYVVYQPELTVSISSGGENVSIANADETILCVVDCPASKTNGTTFGRVTDGVNIWHNGTEATPGASNNQ